MAFNLGDRVMVLYNEELANISDSYREIIGHEGEITNVCMDNGETRYHLNVPGYDEDMCFLDNELKLVYTPDLGKAKLALGVILGAN